MKGILRIFAICLLGTVLSGCSENGAEITHRLIAGYEKAPDHQARSQASAALVHHLKNYFWRDDVSIFASEEVKRENRYAWYGAQHKAFQVFADADDWDALSEFTGGYLFKNELSVISAAIRDRYTGDHPDLLIIRANRLMQDGDIHAAYGSYARAALADKENAYFPRGLAFRYGCTDLAEIWGELTTSAKGFEGTNLPEAERRLTTDELLAARMDLRNGKAPQIPENCPIATLAKPNSDRVTQL